MHVLNLPARHLLRTAVAAALLTVLVVAALAAMAPLSGGNGSSAAEPVTTRSPQAVPSWVADPLAPPALLSRSR